MPSTYPLLNNDPYDYFEEVHAKAMAAAEQEAASFAMIAKDHNRDGNLGYRLTLRLPDSGPFSALTPFEKEAIRSDVLAAITGTATANEFSVLDNSLAEIAGLEALLGICEQIIAGTFSVSGGMHKSGFEGMPLSASDYIQRDPTAIAPNGVDLSTYYRAYDYAGIELVGAGGSEVLVRDVFGISDTEEITSAIFGLSNAIIVTDHQNTAAELAQAEDRFSSTPEQFVFWLHYEPTENDTDSLYLKNQVQPIVGGSGSLAQLLFGRNPKNGPGDWRVYIADMFKTAEAETKRVAGLAVKVASGLNWKYRYLKSQSSCAWARRLNRRIA